MSRLQNLAADDAAGLASEVEITVRWTPIGGQAPWKATVSIDGVNFGAIALGKTAEQAEQFGARWARRFGFEMEINHKFRCFTASEAREAGELGAAK